MLILSRRRDEAVILLDGAIRVVVVEIRGDHVRLGFEADTSIRIDREEIHEKILLDRMGDYDTQGDY